MPMGAAAARNAQPSPPPQATPTVTQQQQQWLKTRHVLSRRYVFYLFCLLFYYINTFFRSTLHVEMAMLPVAARGA